MYSVNPVTDAVAMKMLRSFELNNGIPPPRKNLLFSSEPSYTEKTENVLRNVTLRGFRVIIVAVENQYYIYRACFCK
jgi:hypothetical protein